MPSHAQVVEVGPRDGLQSESASIPAGAKVRMVNMLSNSGLSRVEVTSFVSPKWVPQLADADEVMRTIDRRQGVQYSVLTPNMKGFEKAVEARADAVAIFAAATDQFSQRNINCTVEESLRRFEPVAEAAKAHNIPVRGYVSVAVNCPYSGTVPPQATADVAQELLRMGCFEVSIGDTTGAATAPAVEAVFRECSRHHPLDVFAGHFHDTYGQALPNILTALRIGVSTFDSSVGGLGGCPYAPGASGNVATEDLVYMLTGLGISHGVDLKSLVECSRTVCSLLGKQNSSKVATAMLATREKCVT
eukprot:jgi/Ulvmu1/3865/UM018_0084.1